MQEIQDIFDPVYTYVNGSGELLILFDNFQFTWQCDDIDQMWTYSITQVVDPLDPTLEGLITIYPASRQISVNTWNTMLS